MKSKLSFFFLFVCVSMVMAEDTSPATPEKVCEANTEFTKECGVCKCNSDGTAFSCEKSCAGEQNEPESPVAHEEKCTPGTLFKNKCNECKCPESGLKSQAACTIIGCTED